MQLRDCLILAANKRLNSYVFYAKDILYRLYNNISKTFAQPSLDSQFLIAIKRKKAGSAGLFYVNNMCHPTAIFYHFLYFRVNCHTNAVIVPHSRLRWQHILQCKEHIEPYSVLWIRRVPQGYAIVLFRILQSTVIGRLRNAL